MSSILRPLEPPRLSAPHRCFLSVIGLTDPHSSSPQFVGYSFKSSGIEYTICKKSAVKRGGRTFISAETERIFSGAKLTISPARNRLSEDIIEATECLNRWYRAGLWKASSEATEAGHKKVHKLNTMNFYLNIRS